MDSLYQLVLGVNHPPQPISVSPATLLASVRSVIDILIAEKITATLWLKLPPGKIWHAEIHRYQQLNAGGSAYVCQLPAENDLTTKTNSFNENTSRIFSVSLPATSYLRREYFLLILSPRFCSLILAYRPQRQHQTQQQVETAPASPGLLKALAEPNYQTQSLLAIYGFEPTVIQQVLAKIKSAIKLNALPDAESSFNSASTPEPLLLSQLVTKQIYHQQQIYDIKFKGNQHKDPDSDSAHLQQINPSLLKDDFLSQLCQELRTPLAHMKMALSLLGSPQLKTAQRQRYLQVLNTECDRQNSLITGLSDLIQLARVAEQTTLEPVRLCEIVPGVVSTYQPLAQEKGIMLAYTVPEDLPAVSCISAWLKQIVINLLHNSIKFTPTNGQVWVRARLQLDNVLLEFRDTGIGIAPNDIPKIFDRFYRVRVGNSDDVDGAGLGLTIVQQLLLRCGGSISVKSKLGEGSVFNVLLPIHPLSKP